jgi:hypothetical protein
LAAVLAPIALLALAFSISSTSAFGEAGDTQQPDSGDQILDTQTIGITTPVRPWCGWIALLGDNTAIDLVPAGDGDQIYDGDSITLGATGQQYAIKVGPVGQDRTSDIMAFTREVDGDCSWFADSEKNGVDVETTLSGNSFTAVSSKNANEETDTSMDFTTNDGVDQNLVITNTANDCSDLGFEFNNNPLRVTTSLSATNGAAVVSMVASDTTSNSFCAWTSDYTVKLPVGMKPTFGNSTYLYTGPTIINTMVYGRP